MTWYIWHVILLNYLASTCIWNVLFLQNHTFLIFRNRFSLYFILVLPNKNDYENVNVMAFVEHIIYAYVICEKNFQLTIRHQHHVSDPVSHIYICCYLLLSCTQFAQLLIRYYTLYKWARKMWMQCNIIMWDFSAIQTNPDKNK